MVQSCSFALASARRTDPCRRVEFFRARIESHQGVFILYREPYRRAIRGGEDFMDGRPRRIIQSENLHFAGFRIELRQTAAHFQPDETVLVRPACSGTILGFSRQLVIYIHDIQGIVAPLA